MPQYLDSGKLPSSASVSAGRGMHSSVSYAQVGLHVYCLLGPFLSPLCMLEVGDGWTGSSLVSTAHPRSPSQTDAGPNPSPILKLVESYYLLICCQEFLPLTKLLGTGGVHCSKPSEAPLTMAVLMPVLKVCPGSTS